MMAITTIPLRRETRDKLRTLGSKGETYDEIVNRLLARLEVQELLEEHYRLLAEKERFIPLDEL
jgi:hypothetical protein